MRYHETISLFEAGRGCGKTYALNCFLYMPLINFMGYDNFSKLSIQQRREFLKTTKQGAY